MSVYHNEDAEARLVGTLATSSELSDYIVENLVPDLVVTPSLKIVFDVLISFRKNGKYLDNTELIKELTKQNLLERIDKDDKKARQFITKLYVNPFANKYQIDQCLELLKKYKWKRVNRSNLKKLQILVDNEKQDDFNVGLVETYLDAETDKSEKWKHDAADVLHLNDLREKDWIDTGFKLFDDRFNGIDRGELNLFAARAGVGKSIIGLNVLSRVSKEFWRSNKDTGTNLYCVYYSLEMRRKQIVRRLCSSEGRILTSDLRDADRYLDKPTEQTAQQIVEAYLRLPIIWRIGTASLTQIAGDIALLSKKYDIGLVIVDHLQYFDEDEKGGDERVQTRRATKLLSRVAKNLDIPILIFGQLNREIERRYDEKTKKRVMPKLSDIFMGGEMDYSKVVIMFPEETNPQLMTSALPEKEVDLVVVKNREGPQGSSPLKLYGQYSRFTEERDDEEPPLIEDTDLLNEILGKRKRGRPKKSELTEKDETVQTLVDEVVEPDDFESLLE